MNAIRTAVLALLACGLAAGPAAAAQSESIDVKIRRCLANWGQHPFDPDSPRYRTIEPKVSVFGIGGDVRDDEKTPAHELVYVRPNVSVMSKTDLELLNPNGWYCLERSVAVMSKVEIHLHCDAHLATTEEGVSVMGGGDQGVNVMGATKVERVGCSK